MQRAFVTGGSGFVGRNLLAALAARRTPAVALARSDGAAAAVVALGAAPARGDLGDVAALTAGMRGCDVVFHAAAHVNQHGTRDEFFAANVTGTEHVLAAARAAGVRQLVHVGTEAVLADGRPIVRADETTPYPRHHAGLYALTKALAEQAVIAASDASLATVVVRPRFIWGRGDTSMGAEMAAAVRRGRFAWADGGHYLTSTCHVANVVEGALRAAERGGPGRCYFLTDGAPVEFRWFVSALLRGLGVEPPTRNVPRWLGRAVAASTAWMAEPPVTRTALALVAHEVTVVDARARRELGYVGEMSIERGLAEMGTTQLDRRFARPAWTAGSGDALGRDLAGAIRERLRGAADASAALAGVIDDLRPLGFDLRRSVDASDDLAAWVDGGLALWVHGRFGPAGEIEHVASVEVLWQKT